MGDSTIEWLLRPGTKPKTWNAVRGCTPQDAGCDECYAKKLAHRFSGPGRPYEGLTVLTEDGVQWTGETLFVPKKLDEPLRWRTPCTVFVNSMSDIFHPGFTDEQIAAQFGVMAACPQHLFIVLTKQDRRMVRWFEWLEAMKRMHRSAPVQTCLHYAQKFSSHPKLRDTTPIFSRSWPLPNVFGLVSASNQKALDKRAPSLLETPWAIRGVSAEPLLGPIDASRYLPVRPSKECPACEAGDCPEADRSAFLNWIIVGGESSSRARPMHPAWARRLRDQCVAAGVAFFMKQWGSHAPFFDESKFTFAETESDSMAHVYVNEDGGRGRCWITDGDGNWSNWEGDHPDPSTFVMSKHRDKKTAGRLLDGREWNEIPEVGCG